MMTGRDLFIGTNSGWPAQLLVAMVRTPRMRRATENDATVMDTEEVGNEIEDSQQGQEVAP